MALIITLQCNRNFNNFWMNLTRHNIRIYRWGKMGHGKIIGKTCSVRQSHFAPHFPYIGRCVNETLAAGTRHPHG